LLKSEEFSVRKRALVELLLIFSCD